jgi:hypothetical protein
MMPYRFIRIRAAAGSPGQSGLRPLTSPAIVVCLNRHDIHVRAGRTGLRCLFEQVLLCLDRFFVTVVNPFGFSHVLSLEGVTPL